MTTSGQMRTIGADEASRLLPMPGLIENLRTFFIAGCEVPPRHHHTISVPGDPDATLLLMPSWQHKSDDGGFLGVKLVTVFPGNANRGMPGLTSCYLLFDSGTGAQLATIDGNVITARRTVAASALAASYLARRMPAICLFWAQAASQAYCPRHIELSGISVGSRYGTSISKAPQEW